MKDYLIEKRLKELCPKGYLTNEQNNALLKEYAQDIESGVLPEDSVARTLLILGNNKLIFYVLKTRFKEEDMFDDDYLSVGKIGLIKAIDTYDADKNLEFCSFAIGCIIYKILHYNRQLKAQGNMKEQQIFLEEPIIDGDNSDESIRLIDTIADDEDLTATIQDKCLIEEITKNMKYLTPNEVLTITLAHGLFDYPKLTFVDIGKRLNRSRTAVIKNYSHAIKKLKVLMTNDENLNYIEKKLKERTLKQVLKNESADENGEI